MAGTMVLGRSTETGRAARPNWPKAAGVAYVGAWVVGLAAFGAGPAAEATDAEIARYFADHRIASTVQSLLIHGIAAIALLIVLVALRRRDRSTALVHAAGLTAVALSLVQCGLDVWRSLVSTGATTASLVHTIDRIDGFKMLALAVAIAASLTVFRSTGTSGRTARRVGIVTVVALVVSGVAYATATTSLLLAAYVSLPLLLTAVCYAGVSAGRVESR